jgi:hypothetical protein
MTVERAHTTITGVGRLLATVLRLSAVVTVSTVALLVALGTGSWSALWVPVALIALLVLPGVMRRPVARERRRLRDRVGDPATLTGQWRRALTAAWSARDQYAEAVAERAPSPLRDRLAEHQATVDAALERCGDLARHGQRLHAQLRSLRSRRLQAELLVERQRDPRGGRAASVARRLNDAQRLREEVRAVQTALDDEVHRLRTAVWHATTLGVDEHAWADAMATDPVGDLERLRAALADLDRAEWQAAGGVRPAAAGPPPRGRASGQSGATGRRAAGA